MKPYARRPIAALITLFAAGVSACAPTYSRSTSAEALTDAKGMTLYTFDKDLGAGGRSTCYGPCAVQWPPVAADAVKGAAFASVEREDGTQQATLGGKPLYYFAGDPRPGDRNGDGVGGVWHIALPVERSARPRSPAYEGHGAYGRY